MKKCPYCAEEVQDDAIKCKHCSEMLNKEPAQEIKKGDRKCHECGYVGQMKKWLSNYNAPQFIALLGLLFYVIPGLVFIAWGWGKHKCPSCGALAKSSPIVQ